MELAAEGYRVAVVDIQSEKPPAWRDTINTEFGEGMAYGFWCRCHQRAERHGGAGSRGRRDFWPVPTCWSTAQDRPAAFISDFELGDFDRSLQVNLVELLPLRPRRFFPSDDPRRHSGGASFRSTQIEAKWAASITPATARRNLAA